MGGRLSRPNLTAGVKIILPQALRCLATALALRPLVFLQWKAFIRTYEKYQSPLQQTQIL